jgi:molecular chaperone HscB
MTRDFFEVLGLPRVFHLDERALETRYLALSKETHPDRFAKALPREQLEAVVRSTELNDAYKTLKDDIKRAEYLLKLEGIHIGDDKPIAPSTGETKQLVVDPRLLLEIMELREQLTVAQHGRDTATVERLSGEVRQRHADALQSIDASFTAFASDGDRTRLDAVARALVSLRYYGRFLDEVAAHEDAFAR